MKVKFSEDEQKIIQRAVYAVWEYVAYDCLVATAEDKGKDVDRVTMSRRDVIEISLDADRPLIELVRETKDWPKEQQTDFLQRWENASYEQKIKLVKPAFTYTRYGT